MGSQPKNVFLKIESVKQKLSPVTSDMNDKQIRNILCHISYFCHGRRKELTQQERETYDLMLKYKICPKTAYQWFYLVGAPEHIKQKVKLREIGYEEACKLKQEWRMMIGTKSSKDIMNEMRRIVGGLEWKNKNTTIGTI